MKWKAFVIGVAIGLILLGASFASSYQATAAGASRPGESSPARSLSQKHASPNTRLQNARAWYAAVLGTESQNHEAGLFSRDTNVPRGEQLIVFWRVPDARAAYRRLLRMGARPAQSPVDLGSGIVVAGVYDPFGNLFGVIQDLRIKPEDGWK